MGTDQFDLSSQKLNVSQHPDDRMLLNFQRFIVIQLVRFIENGLFDSDLANIVQQGCISKELWSGRKKGSFRKQ